MDNVDYEQIRKIIKEELGTQWKLTSSTFVSQKDYGKFKIIVSVCLVVISGGAGGGIVKALLG